MLDTIELILTSSVVAVFCTGIFSIINSRINAIIGYVAEERREWRKEMEDIADELTMANSIHEIRRVLNKLKVRINPYGMWIKEDFVHDFHIWELIKVMEERPYENQMKNKEKMLIYISLLLQYDREKTEKTVGGRKRIYIIMSLILLVLGSIYLIYMHFFKFKFEYNDTFLATWMVFFISPIIIAIAHPIKGISSIFRKKRKAIYNFFIGLGILLLVIEFAAGYVTLINSIVSYYHITWRSIESGTGYLGATIVACIMAALFSVAKSADLDNVTGGYEDAVKQIYNEGKSLPESNTEK